MPKIQLKNYDENTGNLIGDVYPITNAECVNLNNGKNLQEFLDNSGFDGESNHKHTANDITFNDGDTLQNKFDNDEFKGSDGLTWRPTVGQDGYLSWDISNSTDQPGTINIKGPTGATGPAGKDGVQGERGMQGPTGPRGEQGLKGDTGEQGSNGLTWRPTVDSNGNLSWQLNSDIGPPPTINIKGPQGQKGDKGDPGEQGSGGSDTIISQTPPEGQLLNRVWIQIL